jgi:hypothetical protein
MMRPIALPEGWLCPLRRAGARCAGRGSTVRDAVYALCRRGKTARDAQVVRTLVVRIARRAERDRVRGMIPIKARCARRDRVRGVVLTKRFVVPAE